MIKELIIIIAIIWSTSSAAVTFKQTKEIFAKVQNAAGYHVVLKLDNKEGDVNAFSTGYSIIVTKEMLNFCTTKSQMAFVLGHEIAHHSFNSRGSDKKEELAADLRGFQIAKKAGYNKGAIPFLKKAKKTFGDKGGKVHPDWSIRINQINKGR